MAPQFAEFTDKSKKTIEHFKKDLGRMRTGRASSSLLEGLTVDYYGSQVPLQQLGLISTPEPRQLLIQVYDRGAVDSIEKAIHLAELGLNPSKEGSYLRVSIPALTEERRKELIKKLHKMGEETKIALRNNRRDQLEVLKGQQKSKAISEDDLRRAQEEVQKITDKFVVEVDQIVGAKEKELLEV